MENSSIKEKIFYWGGVTLISSVILGGSYYIYKSIFGSEEKDNNIIDNDNNSLGNSLLILNNEKKSNDPNNNILKKENSLNNNISSTIFQPSLNNLGENENNNIINTQKNVNNINNIENNVNNENNNIPQNSINIFSNNKIFLKSIGINIDESKIFNNNNRLTEEGIIRLIIYINYLAEKFYILDNPSLDQKRRDLLNSLNNNNSNNINNINNSNNINNNEINTNSIININEENNQQQIYQEYLTLCNETITTRQTLYQISLEKILSSLNVPINFQEFEQFLKNVEPQKLEKISIKITMELNNELFKYDLDIMDINKTKEAYIYFLKIYIEQAKGIYEQQENLKKESGENENIEENNSIFVFQFMTLKIQIDDRLYEKYHITDEHLKLLVNKYNLLVDNEINQLQNEFDDINNKFGNGNIN